MKKKKKKEKKKRKWRQEAKERRNKIYTKDLGTRILSFLKKYFLVCFPHTTVSLITENKKRTIFLHLYLAPWLKMNLDSVFLTIDNHTPFRQFLTFSLLYIFFAEQLLTVSFYLRFL